MNFADEVIIWYQQNKRTLPWRNTKDPYIIWLSEIILQQTRVEQGMPYFYRFAEQYPTVADFASATENEILSLWQGLGYYSRARNMHHTAQMVMEDHSGYFPKTYNELLDLKGIGEYTAAAISSFTANEARAVVDGNVFRVLARYFGIETPVNSSKGKKEFTIVANEVMDTSQPGTFNQAIMEFGSLQCKPKNPLCVSCPLNAGCIAFKENRIYELPVKLKNQRIRQRYFNYIVVEDHDLILMQKRGANDIWQNMYEFPLIETLMPIPPEELIKTEEFVNKFGKGALIHSVFGPVKHVLSHQKLYANFIVIKAFPKNFKTDNNWIFAGREELSRLPKPKLIFEFINNFFLN